MRTRFVSVDGAPRQVVGGVGVVSVELVDVSGGADPETDAREVVAQEVVRPFDLSTGPLLRTTLIRLGQDDHVLVLVCHHIVSDGWSMGVFLREINALYPAFLAGEPSPLPPLPVQYADFAVWQRTWLAEDELRTQLDYWRERLAGMPAALELPLDRPRPAVPSFEADVVTFEVPADVTARLRALSREQGTTLFMTLLAAFQLLLSRYTGSTDIAVGSPIAGRVRPELEGLIGFFVNTLVLRTDLSGDPSFVELLGRVRETALGAYAHQDLPFEQLVEELAPVRDLSRNPLVQVTFNVMNAPLERLGFAGIDVETFGTAGATNTIRADIECSMVERGDVLVGRFAFGTDLFGVGTVERFVGGFLRVLGGVVGDPGGRLSGVGVLGEVERGVVCGWSGGNRVYVLDGSLCVVPVGVVGELYVGGGQLARGYVGQAGLTAERFVADPFVGGGARMYRTGDVVRWGWSGGVEFVGRVDDQVKIRGVRVEPAEVESVLSGCVGVGEVVVLACGDGLGGRRLVAYVVGGEGFSLGVVRGFAQERLPDYLVPSVFVVLDEFPLTSSGKIDRRALPAPESGALAETAEEYVAPRDDTEEALAAIWCEVLDLPRVGVRDNFFVLGGHSLLGTKMMSRVRQRLGVDLPLRTLFEHATIAELAGLVDAARRTATDDRERIADLVETMSDEEVERLLDEME
ncbi:condensation domain-containing protein [Actinophytocola sp.]|uniref:condensation domain-containing protein n=1 Tax=Actinophytocola sp. TaxID=1872138 RepID=UPI00389A3090